MIPVAGLAYVPFRDPLPWEPHWLVLLVPLVLAIVLVYKTLKLEDLRELPRQTVITTAQLLAYLGLGTAALWLVILLV